MNEILINNLSPILQNLINVSLQATFTSNIENIRRRGLWKNRQKRMRAQRQATALANKGKAVRPSTVSENTSCLLF